MTFFAMRSPRDMFAKAQREHLRLMKVFDIDNLFNFFVTAYHIKDYVLHDGRIKQVALEEFLSDQDMRDCRDLCDKGKHLVLSKRSDPQTTHIHYSGCLGGAPLGAVPLGSSVDNWILTTEERSIDVQVLANSVINKWASFLEANGL
ncbi:MAG: hypothetical protein KKF58_06375 [Gammaproteobacteria bacterium]|nr:hypothetical protein [Gammaproteobacteria bacterium]MBU1447919.1 hypothetical protein [Gammaproteobacteria bacterium]